MIYFMQLVVPSFEASMLLVQFLQCPPFLLAAFDAMLISSLIRKLSCHLSKATATLRYE